MIMQIMIIAMLTMTNLMKMVVMIMISVDVMMMVMIMMMVMMMTNVDQVAEQELTVALIGDWRQQCTRANTHASSS